jgi:phospholipid-transporting ATPase
LLASAFKEVQEDLKRHQSDSELNARNAEVLSAEDGTFTTRRWRDIVVGDIVRLPSDSFIPADLVLLASSEPEGLCYIETANLDGETNLKIKQASPHTSAFVTPRAVQQSLQGTLRSEQPNNSLYTYEGTLELRLPDGSPKTVPLGPDQILLRGAQLRNTPWVYGLVVFTGHETKLMRNATAAPIKRTAVERQVNVQIVFLFVLLLAMSLASALGGSIRAWFFDSNLWYLGGVTLVPDAGRRARQFVEDVLTFIILYNNLIPISLIVTMEVAKFQQAQLINADLDMYHSATDTPALCRTSSLVEELGQIGYIFSDKTGTLTRNEMEFRMCSVAGVAYADVVDESKRGDPDDPESMARAWKTFAQMQDLLRTGSGLEKDVVEEFLTLLAVCHTVIPEMKDGKVVYQASSPDEAALVAGAETLGYRFHVRSLLRPSSRC